MMRADLEIEHEVTTFEEIGLIDPINMTASMLQSVEQTKAL